MAEDRRFGEDCPDSGPLLFPGAAVRPTGDRSRLGAWLFRDEPARECDAVGALLGPREAGASLRSPRLGALLCRALGALLCRVEGAVCSGGDVLSPRLGALLRRVEGAVRSGGDTSSSPRLGAADARRNGEFAPVCPRLGAAEPRDDIVCWKGSSNGREK